MEKRILKGMAFLCMLALATTTAFAGAQEETTAETKTKIRFMTTDYSGEPMTKNSPIYQALEAYTGVDLEIQYVPHAVYDERFSIALASGDLPDIILAPQRNSSVISAARAGQFWDLTDYLPRFPNLSKANPVVLNNMSIDGRVYGIYRSRNLGRNAIVYRKDWARNVGIPEPKTLDELYELMYRMTHNDPDQNGEDDTYAMVVTSYPGPWRVMLPWFGLPNKWGKAPDGSLQPDHLFPEYKDAMNFWKKMYENGLINRDFAVYNPSQWNDPIVAEKAGMIIDVADLAGRWENSFKDAGVEAEIGVIGGVEGPEGYRLLPFGGGYNGFFMIPKTTVKTEEKLMEVLSFMDKLGDREMQDLLEWGIEGRHHTLTEDGFVDPTLSSGNDALTAEFGSSNQILYFFPTVQTPRIMTEVRQRQTEVMKENEAFVIANPAEPLVSNVYAERGAQLDQIIEDARINYIVGRITMAEFDAEVERWKRNGGEQYMQEINEQYKALK